MNKRAPTRAFGLLEQAHVGLVWEAVALTGVAGDATADNIFPSGLSASLAGKDMVEIEFVAVEGARTVLAGVFVALVDVLPSEFDFFTGQSVEKQKHNDRGHTDFEAHRLHHVLVWFGLGKVMPAGKVVGEVVVVLVAPDDVGVSLIKQSESAADAADIDRLPQSVQHQHMLVEQ